MSNNHVATCAVTILPHKCQGKFSVEPKQGSAAEESQAAPRGPVQCTMVWQAQQKQQCSAHQLKSPAAVHLVVYNTINIVPQ